MVRTLFQKILEPSTTFFQIFLDRGSGRVFPRTLRVTVDPVAKRKGRNVDPVAKRKGRNVDPVVLHLVLTRHWFDEMLAGRKDIEYRACTPYWRRLLWGRRRRITHARFSRGYTSRTILRPVLAVDCGGCPYDGWDGRFYRLHLGEIVENKGICERADGET